MWIEPLFNALGVPLTFSVAAIGLALPLAVTGGLLRRRARRERTRWELVSAAHTGLKDVAPGRVAVTGSFRDLGGRAVVEDGEHCVVVERSADAPAVADGTKVLVVGYATRQVDNPLGGAFRDRARVWVVEGDGGREPVLVTANPELPGRQLKRARRNGRIGFALLGAAVAVAVGSAALCWRAYDEDVGALDGTASVD
jgi:hypothetical protein